MAAAVVCSVTKPYYNKHNEHYCEQYCTNDYGGERRGQCLKIHYAYDKADSKGQKCAYYCNYGVKAGK